MLSLGTMPAALPGPLQVPAGPLCVTSAVVRTVLYVESTVVPNAVPTVQLLFHFMRTLPSMFPEP